MLTYSCNEPTVGVELKITTVSGEFVSINQGLTSSNDVYVTDLNGEIVLNKLRISLPSRKQENNRRLHANTGRDGKVMGSYTTDDTGYVKLEDVEPGTYVAWETAVPDRYIKSEEAFLIEIDENAEDPVIITITNTEKKELLFKKIDEDTGKPMAGVVFEIFLNNVSIGTRTTDANGEIRLPYADPGSYRFEERHTLAGYQLSRMPISRNKVYGENQRRDSSGKCQRRIRHG